MFSKEDFQNEAQEAQFSTIFRLLKERAKFISYYRNDNSPESKEIKEYAINYYNSKIVEEARKIVKNNEDEED